MSKKLTQRLVITSGIILAIILLAPLYSALLKSNSPVQERVFPNLMKDINDINQIIVKTASNHLTFIRGEKNWTLQEKYNYPVPIETLQALLIGITDLRYLEEKTSKPERYADIGVEDIHAPEARSKLIQLTCHDGRIIAEMLVGRQTPAKGLAANTASFIRKPLEATSWMADGLRPVSDNPFNWLQQQILNIPASDIETVQLMPFSDPSTKKSKSKKSKSKKKKGSTLTLKQSKQKKHNFQIEGLSRKTKIKDQKKVNAVANSLFNLQFLDIAPATALKDKAWTRTALFKDFNGRAITLHLADASKVKVTIPQDDVHNHEHDHGEETQKGETKSDVAPELKGYWVKVSVQQNDIPTEEEKFKDWIYLIPQETGDKLVTNLKQLVK